METTQDDAQSHAQDKDTHQYLTDASGKRTHVLLSIEEYEELVDRLLDDEEAEEIRSRQTDDAESISLEELKQRLGL